MLAETSDTCSTSIDVEADVLKLLEDPAVVEVAVDAGLAAATEHVEGEKTVIEHDPDALPPEDGEGEFDRQDDPLYTKTVIKYEGVAKFDEGEAIPFIDLNELEKQVYHALDQSAQSLLKGCSQDDVVHEVLMISLVLSVYGDTYFV